MNGGSAFRWRSASTNGGHVYWFGWLESGSEGNRRFDAAQGALYPHLGGHGVEICPALNRVQPKFKLKATGFSLRLWLQLVPVGSAGPATGQPERRHAPK